jgi:signal transduction histidine kinase
MHFPLAPYQMMFVAGVAGVLGIAIVWVYFAVTEPVIKLQKAVSNIAEGNLDYEIDFKRDDEIGQLCDDFEKMRKKLKESMVGILAADEINREMIKNISHDIETPLTSIKGYVEGIMDGVADSPEKRDRYIKIIYNKTIEIERLIEELTLYSKIDSNSMPFNFKKIPANQYFNNFSSDLRWDLEAKGLKFYYDSEVREQTEFMIDSKQFKRAINNIIINSVKYVDKSKPENSLRMRVKEVGNMIQLEITDNGVGIAKKDMPYVFDRFFRGDVSRNTSSGGSGIGLSIVKRIVKEHNGKVFITSELGKGTTVYITMRKI